MKVHYYDSTQEAYDASNHSFDQEGNDGGVLTGHILVIKSERVVALVWAWPVAVSVAKGRMHQAAPTTDLTALLDNIGVSREIARHAVLLSEGLGYGVAGAFDELSGGDLFRSEDQLLLV